MKAFLLTDTHFGLQPLSYDKHLKMMKEFFYEFFIPLIKENYEEGDIVIHLGDLYDNRTSIPIDVLNTVEQIMSDIAKILPIHLIVGNHDIFNKSTNDINSPKSLRWIPNINIYEEPTILELGSKKCLLMPWVEKRKDQIAYLQQYSGSDYLFCHSDLSGCRMHLNSVAWKNNHKVDIEDFSGFKYCYSGHIHIRQENKNFKFIGSPYQMDRNDVGDQKGIYILDIETGKESFHPNTISPQFIKLDVLCEEDIEKMMCIDTSKDYVDLKISNSLLLNNRKVRRNIDSLLEKGNFAKVEYINDIVKEDLSKEDEDVITSDIDFEDIELNDLENMILKYISSKQYPEKVREQLISEFMNILTLSKSNNE